MKKHSTMLSSLMVVLVLILTGCRGLPTDSKPASVSASGKSGWNRNWNEKESKYTKADYEPVSYTHLGMQLPTFECETEKMACFTEEGETVGAISYASDVYKRQPLFGLINNIDWNLKYRLRTLNQS